VGCFKDCHKAIDKMKYIKFYNHHETNKFLFNNIALGDILFCSDVEDRYIHNRVLVIGIKKDTITGMLYLTELDIETNTVSTTKVSYDWVQLSLCCIMTN
jgi:hypothetical protein